MVRRAREREKQVSAFMVFLTAIAVLMIPITVLPGASHAYSPEKAARAREVTRPTRLTPAYLTAVAARLNAAGIPDGPESSGAAKTTASPASDDGGFLRNERNGTPVFMNREALAPLIRRMGKIVPGASPDQTALSFVAANADVFGLAEPESELVFDLQRESAGGTRHIRFAQVFRGVPVWHNYLVVHLDSSSTPYAFNGVYDPTPTGIDVVPAVTEETALRAAIDVIFGGTRTPADPSPALRRLLSYDGPEATLCLHTPPSADNLSLVWHVLIRPNVRDEWHFFVDALTGKVVEKYNASPLETPATATAFDALGVPRTFNVTLDDDTYHLVDSEANIYTYDARSMVIDYRNQPVLVYSTDNTWPDSIAVSAHSNTRFVYDYYLSEHGRKGIDGHNGDLPVLVNYTEDGSPFNNAFWNGRMITFGNGLPFAAALDVVAHELTHGVVQYTVGLDYQYESGALNEAIADFMAAMVDPDDWEIGEDLPIGALRDISDPGRFGLPADMSEYRILPLDQDYGGVHINMSIPSRAGYLLAESIGREKAADIWYSVLSNLYLTPKSGFSNMRHAALQSAADLFGEDSAEVDAVAASFDTVGIVDLPAEEQPVNRLPEEGDQFIAFVFDYDGSDTIAIAVPDIESVNDIYFPTDFSVYTHSSSPLSVCRDGSVMIFVDSASNLRFIDLETFDMELIDDSGEWSSIKLSPDGSKLAATTVNPDSTLYVLDLRSPEKSKAIHLYTPSTEGVKMSNALFADALDWDSTGSLILYDAFNSMPVSEGDPIEWWDVNILDVDSGIIRRVKTPTGSGIQVGNPSFAKTNDRYIVCDYFSVEEQFNYIAAMDLYSHDISLIRENGFLNGFTGPIPNIGHPKYSPDDRHIIFQHYELLERSNIMYKLPLSEDRMTADGAMTPYFYGVLPVWYVRSDQGGPVLVGDDAPFPAELSLLPNYPNPFNPSTTIPFVLGRPGRVTLVVYDALGRKVDTIVDGFMEAGRHAASFDGSSRASGMYFYRLAQGSAVKTGKMLLVK